MERELTHIGAANFLKEWPERLRARRLEAELGIAHSRPGATVILHSEAEGWGALYVLEGSRFGAKALAKHTTLADRSAFFRDACHCRFWPEFLDRLEASDERLNDAAGMAAGARKAFQAFLWDEMHSGVSPGRDPALVSGAAHAV